MEKSKGVYGCREYKKRKATCYDRTGQEHKEERRSETFGGHTRVKGLFFGGGLFVCLSVFLGGLELMIPSVGFFTTATLSRTKF